MDTSPPPTSRPGARVLLFGPAGRILLLHASLPTRPSFWLCPGGGVEQGETWEQAAHREVLEETGLSITLGPPVWYRRHAYTDGGRRYDLFERYFVARVDSERVTPTRQDTYILGHRWWRVDEVSSSSAQFAPRRFQELILPVARGQYPRVPFDCGV